MIKINGFPIDAALTENHELDSEVTKYPIEQGVDIGDAARPLPRSVTITGKVSDTPMGAVAIARTQKAQQLAADNGAPDTLPTQDALALLEGLWATPQLVTIQTSLRTYDNMLMSTCSIPREAKDGQSISFTATFELIVQITNERTTVRVAVPIAAPPQQKGPVAAKPDESKNLVPRAVDQATGTWFDPDINGWRFGASFNGRNWEYFKGKPVTQPAGLTDAQLLANNTGGFHTIDQKPDGTVVSAPAYADYTTVQSPTPAQNAGQQVQIPSNTLDLSNLQDIPVPGE